MNWNGVSYIGKTARMARNARPPVHSPLPFQACCAMPSVTKPSSIAPASMRAMFSVGPSVGRANTGSSSARVSSFASPSP
jgi:hypothetical protein